MKCAECFYLFYFWLSHLCVNSPNPDLLQILLLPLLHTSLQRVCFGNFHVLANNSSKDINHSCTQREILYTQCDDKMKHVWSKPCVPVCQGLCYLLKEHVRNILSFCYSCDSKFYCLLLGFIISEAAQIPLYTGRASKVGSLLCVALGEFIVPGYPIF